MSFSSPTKNCPRCNTQLPANALFCGTCGMQFSAPAAQGAPPGSNYAPTQYGGQNAPGGWQQNQPGYPPPGQPGFPPPAQPGFGGYPPGQPGPGGYAPPAVMTPPKQGGSGKLIAIILIVVVLVGGGIGGFLFLRGHTTSPSSPIFDRHNLQSNVPLPDNSTFVSMKTITENGDTPSGGAISFDEWIWTVSNKGPASVQQFYQTELPKNGWKNVQPSNSNSDSGVVACQGTQALIVDASQHLQDSNSQGTPTTTVDAPQGGSALGIALTSNPELVQLFCIASQATP